MEVLSVARTCVGSTSLSNIDRKLKGSSTCQVIARNSSSFFGFTFLPKGLSFPDSLKRQEGRLERRAPSALLNAHEYRKQQLEKVFLKEVGSDPENDDDGDLCPIECVREINKLSELEQIIEDSKSAGALVVVDFFRTSCGSCRYIEKGFQKLCKGAGNGEASVIFLKHNVRLTYPLSLRLHCCLQLMIFLIIITYQYPLSKTNPKHFKFYTNKRKKTSLTASPAYQMTPLLTALISSFALFFLCGFTTEF
jgi:thiol-disulfide isomerase/thioredoxin